MKINQEDFDTSDFPSQSFNDDSIQVFNKKKESCLVIFPINVYSYVHFSHPLYDQNKRICKSLFSETLRVRLIKTRI